MKLFYKTKDCQALVQTSDELINLKEFLGLFEMFPKDYSGQKMEVIDETGTPVATVKVGSSQFTKFCKWASA